MSLAHIIDNGPRTTDIQIESDIYFESMSLSKQTLKGLKKAGFYKPSPIQFQGIPLGRCGFDLILEAKSGTGKTAVFTIIALEMLDLSISTQVLVLAPTREIAAQITDVIKIIGKYYEDLRVEVFMGGFPLKQDINKLKKKTVHIVVGSPGRLRYLVQDGFLDVSRVRLLILDEADKLMEPSFQSDINYIYSLLPERKQVIASSATFNVELRNFITKYLRKPCHICPDSISILKGISQKIIIVQHSQNICTQTQYRYKELIKLFRTIQFKQCLIFCNYQSRVKELKNMLTRDKWPVETLYGKQEQTDRLDALRTLQEFKCRILIASDLAARGIDASNVDLVINFEPPFEFATYLHRIGRAGRYGSYGTAISILSEGKEEIKFKEMLNIAQFYLEVTDAWTNEIFDLGGHGHIEKNSIPLYDSVAYELSLSKDIPTYEQLNESYQDYIKSSKLEYLNTLSENNVKLSNSNNETTHNNNNGYAIDITKCKNIHIIEDESNNMCENSQNVSKIKTPDNVKIENKKSCIWLKPYHKEYYENFDVTENCEELSTVNLGEVRLDDIPNLNQSQRKPLTDSGVSGSDCSIMRNKRKSQKGRKSVINSCNYDAWRQQMFMMTFQIQYALYIKEMSKLC